MDRENGKNKRLTLEEIEQLSGEEFDALPEDERRRYFQYMDRENSPTEWEFYGYAEEWRDILGLPEEDDWTGDAGPCDGRPMPEPTPQLRPEDREPTEAARLDAAGSFGEAIFAYTRRQALADGVLVDVTETAEEAGFRIPVALTRAVWAEYVEVPEGVACQDEPGRLWDILWMCRCGIGRGKDRDASEVLFRLHVRNDDREGEPPLVTLKVVCGPDDDGNPCLTIMRPDED